MLCQNAPFAPIYDSWKYGRDHGAGMPVRRHKAGRTRAHELANAQPPFHVQGGVRDSLEQSSGEVMIADNRSVDAAIDAFGKLESIDIGSAAATAVACLRDAACSRRIPFDAAVLLNITSGGRARLERDYSLVSVEPTRRFSGAEVADGRALEEVAEMLPSLSG
jgi:cysteate synthase